MIRAFDKATRVKDGLNPGSGVKISTMWLQKLVGGKEQ
jgi:hypothetical protein